MGVARNVKDVCVSFYHMEQMSPNLGLPKDTIFDDYIDFFISGRPAIYGDYWSHLKDVMKYKGHPNLKEVWNEDINDKFEENIQELANFTGYEISTEKMKILKKHMNIDNFRENDAVNGRPAAGVVPDDVRKNWRFIRKGGVGGWKDYFTNEEKLRKFDAWVQENMMDEDGNAIEGLRF